jgi:hypothetical protein
MTIVEFLTARLDEDATAAHEAAAFYDDADENGVSWRGHEGKTESGSTYFWLVPHLGVIYDPASGRHIVRHNPAHVLAEVKAKRERLALYVEVTDVLFHGSRSGDRIKYQRESGRFEALDTEVRRDAAVYADHPDYDEGWRIG